MLRSLDIQRHCPACGSDRSVYGQLSVRACSECGLVWTMLDAVDLRERLDAAGTDETRRWLASEVDDRPLC